jgi:subtilase family serine protease
LNRKITIFKNAACLSINRGIQLNRGQTSGLFLIVFLTLTILAVPSTQAMTTNTNTPNLDTNYKSWVDGSAFQYQVHPQIAKITSYAEGILANTVFELRRAYNLNPLYSAGYTGKGQTVVIVNAYGSPTVYEDLLMFIQWQNANGANLPWTTIQDVKSHLHIYYPMGKPVFDANDPIHLSWAMETTLDVDMVHAIAPNADIALVIAPNSNNRSLDYAIFYSMVHHLGGTISLSWGDAESEISTQNQIRQVRITDAIFKLAMLEDITVFAGSGDWGSTNEADYNNAFFPASDPYVTAVGGTNLFMNCADGFMEGTQSWDGQNHVGIEYSYEIAGNDYQAMVADGFPVPFDMVTAGGAMSSLFPLPSWQKGITLTDAAGSTITPTGRCTSDVSFNSGVYGGLGVVFFSAASPGLPILTIVGGTSAGSPFWAALTAIAGQYVGHSLGYLNPELYAHRAALYKTGAIYDIKSGDNTYPTGNDVKGYCATKGWDAPTGIGSPNAAVLVPKLRNIAG